MSNICTGCEQAINEEYIVDKENFMWHTFCYSSEYEEAYKERNASYGEPLSKEYHKWDKNLVYGEESK